MGKAPEKDRREEGSRQFGPAGTARRATHGERRNLYSAPGHLGGAPVRRPLCQVNAPLRAAMARIRGRHDGRRRARGAAPVGEPQLRRRGRTAARVLAAKDEVRARLVVVALRRRRRLWGRVAQDVLATPHARAARAPELREVELRDGGPRSVEGVAGDLPGENGLLASEAVKPPVEA
eukprot:CAMPEP_0176268916 /NCGR_PEP_ID=MMETSP0121_2-20121125/43925_1 /TAXON_ID=160619 /ORGANISM="Kryptoperidinium foliaceum, Strain CCMP 1326" /LENGTH=177 /DNA_ID=CAMNT_0017609033 /DNA_START=83 /DNA_END=617 /DNA_ORIENTATION=-